MQQDVLGVSACGVCLLGGVGAGIGGGWSVFRPR